MLLQTIEKFKMHFEDYGELECTVPASMYSVLLDNNKIPDPFWRNNEVSLTDLSRKDCEFSSAFTIPSEFLEKENLTLCFDGIDTVADIYLNGRKIGSADNMHCKWEFDIKPYAKVNENLLRVYIYSPVEYMEQKQKIHYINGDKNSMDGIGQIRKSCCMSGWDWAPKLPDMGIFRKVSVLAFDNRIEDVFIRQKHLSKGVLLNIKAEFTKETEKAYVTVTAQNGEKSETELIFGEGEILIENPQLWWPNGLGEHPLYEVNVKIENDERSLKIGLRTLTVSTQKDQYGKEFCFVVNGVKVFSMGADYVPEDSLISRLNPQRTEKLIKSCVMANHNSIRVWGGGFYPHDWFYELCDKYGIIVWQDMMIACIDIYLSKWYKNTIIQEAQYNLKRIRNHACLGIISGNNEMELFTVYTRDKLYYNDYLELYEHIFPDICAEIAPDTFYWPSSPSSGGGFDNPNDDNRGDQHYWGAWHDNVPFESYREHYFRFCSEFGFESFPSMKTIKTFAEEKDFNPFSKVMELHQKCVGGNTKMLSYASDKYLYPSNFEHFVYTTQILQADAIRYGVEHFRRNRGRCMGAVYWQLNDCWPVASWASIDYYGRWKALHYASKRFFAPVLMSLHEKGTSVTINLSNEQFKAFNGKIKYAVKTASLQTLLEKEVTVNVEQMQAKDICTEDFAQTVAGKEEYTLLVATLLSEAGEEISQSTVLFTKPKYFNFATTDYKTDVKGKNGKFEIKISADSYQKFVELDFNSTDGIFSDNYFDLTDKEGKTVTFETEDKAVTAQDLISQLKIASVATIAE